jgi:NitT/TauT family transport system substrate-binding protein
MVMEGGGHILVNEASLWPDGKFVTTHLIVAASFLDAHPDVVKQLLIGDVAANDYVNAYPTEAQQVVAKALSDLTGSQLPEGTLAKAWSNLEFTVDPIATSLATSAKHATDLGLLDPVDLTGIYDLKLLNEVLADQGKPPVAAP